MTKGLSVTDHAVVRYLERVKGFDIEAVREEIADIVRLGVGAENYSKNGFTYSLSGTVVKTVRPGESPSAAKRRAITSENRTRIV